MKSCILLVYDLICSKSCFLWADETNSLKVVVFKILGLVGNKKKCHL
ncbi:unnamed protein product [Brassica napus]|uniref:(rape) hypothetical protein n=1 Tax=Brassica napus TaxID=3708 RepID=A0A816Z4N3_BRANA|nr:unnamed protein product [Brassica napus]